MNTLFKTCIETGTDYYEPNSGLIYCLGEFKRWRMIGLDITECNVMDLSGNVVATADLSDYL